MEKNFDEQNKDIEMSIQRQSWHKKYWIGKILNAFKNSKNNNRILKIKIKKLPENYNVERWHAICQ